MKAILASRPAKRLGAPPHAGHHALRHRPLQRAAARRRTRAHRCAPEFHPVGLRRRSRRRRAHRQRATDALRRVPFRQRHQQPALGKLSRHSPRIRRSTGQYRCHWAIRTAASPCSAHRPPTSSISATATNSRSCSPPARHSPRFSKPCSAARRGRTRLRCRRQDHARTRHGGTRAGTCRQALHGRRHPRSHRHTGRPHACMSAWKPSPHCISTGPAAHRCPAWSFPPNR